MKPIIAVTMNYESHNSIGSMQIGESNTNAIIDHGGIPILLPVHTDSAFINAILDHVDGVYFTGGVDISPLAYGEDPLKDLGSLSMERDCFEIALYQESIKRHLPILGVCRGHQLINVAAGGSLYQDIYWQKPTDHLHLQSMPGKNKFHNVTVVEDTRLHQLFGQTKIQTNSFHHQAVKDLASGFIASAFASDGMIEAIEYVGDLFILGIQWHPELMYRHHNEFPAIYEAFITAARNAKKAK